MPLAPGDRLGPYEVLAPLGAGGMGEVFRARDTRLGRDVAIKVLPDHLASDHKALARFESEAKAVAALSHPNILFLLDVGESNGTRYAVTELLEGETLRALVARGPLPVRRALEIAHEVVEGLAAAHEKTIVHRDLKPENVFLTKDGHAKVLDFGLARQQPGARDASDTRSPTVSVTEAGAVVGTVAYMSPEQTRGLPVDGRSDQFSLGVVLYEMLSGRRPFARDSAVETLAAILKEEPEPLSAVVPSAPPPVTWIVERCLGKDPAERYDSTRDLAREIAGCRTRLSEGGPGGAVPKVRAAATRRPRRTVLLLGTLGAVLAAAALVGALTLGQRRARPPAPRFERLTSFDGVEGWPSLSPDGKTVAYEKTVDGKKDVYVLRVGGWNPTNLTASLPGDHGEPAFSPDGRLIAFRSDGVGGGIFLMEATGESVRRLTDFGHTPAWFPDGKRIVIGTEITGDPSNIYSESSLGIVDVASGFRRTLRPNPWARQPSVSPRGLRIAFWGTARGTRHRDVYTIGADATGDEAAVAVTADAALDWSPFWSGDGRFLYFSSNRGGSMNLWRVGIDEASGKTRGRPEPVTVPASWAGPFRSTPDGSRAVFPAVEWETILDRVPFDPATEQVTGPATPLARFVTRLDGPSVSPRGDILALSTLGAREDLLLLRPDGSGLRRLTDDAFLNRDAHFTPDGRALVFHSNRSGTYAIWKVGVDGGGLEPVVQTEREAFSSPVPSPDGKRLALQRGSHDLLLTTWPRAADAPLPPPEPRPGEGLGCWPNAWSRDSGHLVGTLLRENALPGGIAVYDVARREWRRLTEAGSFPLFLHDGRRIAFWDGNGVSLVDAEGGRTRELLRFDEPRRLQGFALAPDDSQFYVLRATFQADLWLMDLAPKE